MDFIEQLPKSERKEVICKFSKYAHFLSLTHPFSAAKVAKVFLISIIKLHGVPLSIVTNRDKVFISIF